MIGPCRRHRTWRSRAALGSCGPAPCTHQITNIDLSMPSPPAHPSSRPAAQPLDGALLGLVGGHTSRRSRSGSGLSPTRRLFYILASFTKVYHKCIFHLDVIIINAKVTHLDVNINGAKIPFAAPTLCLTEVGAHSRAL